MTGASNKPLRIDCLAREIPGRVALIASGFDADPALAIELCKDLHECLEGGYRLELTTAAHAKRRQPEFVGHPMRSKLERSTCAVCSRPINQGDDIVYNSTIRRAAHLECGEPIE